MIGLEIKYQYFLILPIWLVSTNKQSVSSDNPHFHLGHFLNWFELHSHITIMMCVGVGIPSSVGLSTSSACWYISHKLFTYVFWSIEVHSTPIISNQWSSYPLGVPHIHSATLWCTLQLSYPLSEPHICHTTISMLPQEIPRRGATGIWNCTKAISPSMLMKSTQDIYAVCSQSALTEVLTAVQELKTKHDKSTIPLYPNIKVYTQVWDIAKIWHQKS